MAKKLILAAGILLLILGVGYWRMYMYVDCSLSGYGSATEDLVYCGEKGNAEAQYWMGELYANGTRVTEDDVEAVRWYLLAAEQDHDFAQFHLGEMYVNGHGVPVDLAAAAGWYHRSSELGNWFAQFELGKMYEEGEGVAQDYVEAYMWQILAGMRVFIGYVSNEMSVEEVARAEAKVIAWIEDHPQFSCNFIIDSAGEADRDDAGAAARCA